MTDKEKIDLAVTFLTGMLRSVPLPIRHIVLREVVDRYYAGHQLVDGTKNHLAGDQNREHE